MIFTCNSVCKTFILFNILIFILFQPFYAQKYLDPGKRLSQYVAESYSTNNGLPTNSLLHLCQTSDGYLWISGYGGLIRYDGYSFKTFNKNNTPVFKTNVIRKLAEDKDGTLWITTQGSGLVSYKSGRFVSHDETLKMKHIHRALFIDDDGGVWSASPDKGWFVYKNGKYEFITHYTNLANIEVRAITKGKENQMWFGTMGDGLYCYQNKAFKVYDKKNGLPNDWVYSLMTDRKGRLWIGTGAGLCYLEQGIIKPYVLPINNTITSIIEDGIGNIWLGTNNGLIRINPETQNAELLSSSGGLPYNFINDLCLDFEGTLWMSLYKGGLARIKDSKFINYTTQNGLKGQVVNALCQIDTQKILVAFDNGLLNIIDHGLVKDFKEPASLTGKRIRHILKDKTGDLWFSTYSGLLKLGKKMDERWYSPSNGFPDNLIRVTFEDSKGNIWVGTRNAGLVKISKNNKTDIYNMVSGLTSNLIMAIEEDKFGNLFVGTSEGDGGLNLIDPNGGLQRFTSEQGLTTDVVFNIYCDPSNTIWIASDAGLFHYKSQKFTNISTREGLKDNNLYDVIEDNAGNLWLPCNSGILKIKKSEVIELIQGQIKSVNCQLFNKSDGMNQSECNPTTQSLKTSDGMLLFPTIDGISLINPGLSYINDFVPPVIIQEMLIDNRSIPFDSALVFKPGKKRYTFRYTALSLYEPSKVQFKYKLEGYDHDWINAGNSRSVSYTNLDGDNYQFRVMACNNDGFWNYEGASLSFKVKPYIYKSVWFYVVFSILVSAIVFLITRLRIIQLKERQVKLEKIIADRTKEILLKNAELQQQKEEILAQTDQLEKQSRELKESNAMKDKLFSVIAHDLRGPIGNLKGFLELALSDENPKDPESQRRLLAMLTEMAQTSFELLENLLNWSLNQRGINTCNKVFFLLNDIVNEVIKLTSYQSRKKQIMVSSAINPDDYVFADINMVRTILRNLITNAIKFTPSNGQIIITSEDKGDFVQIGVKDNGIGISPENNSKLFNQLEFFSTHGTNKEKGSGLGLKLCYDFVVKNGGNIWVESEPGKGSTFFFTLQKPQ